MHNHLINSISQNIQTRVCAQRLLPLINKFTLLRGLVSAGHAKGGMIPFNRPFRYGIRSCKIAHCIDASVLDRARPTLFGRRCRRGDTDRFGTLRTSQNDDDQGARLRSRQCVMQKRVLQHKHIGDVGGNGQNGIQNQVRLM